MSDADQTQPSNADPKDMQDPAHPAADEVTDTRTGAAGGSDVDDDLADQDAEPTMNAPEDVRPDGLDVSSAGAGSGQAGGDGGGTGAAGDDTSTTGGDGSPS